MKVACVYHSVDLDGWMSAANVLKWWKEEYMGRDQPLTFDAGDVFKGVSGEAPMELTFIGWKANDVVPDLSSYRMVILCDICFPDTDMKALQIRVDQDDLRLVWIDHHISSIKRIDGYQHTITYRNGSYEIDLGLPVSTIDGIRNINYAACELTWMYFFNGPVPVLVEILGKYDSFRHKGTPEELDITRYQYGARSVITNYKKAYSVLNEITGTSYLDDFDLASLYSEGAHIYDFMCVEAKRLVKMAFPLTFKHTSFARDYKFLCLNRERLNPDNFGLNYEGYDGFACFWYDNNFWYFSLYSNREDVDCSVIASTFKGGGGHAGAAGFTVNFLDTVLKI